MAFAIKTQISDPDAQTFVFSKVKSMYGGKRLAAGDVVYLFNSENEGGTGLFARGLVTAAALEPRASDRVRQTPRLTLAVRRTGTAARPLGRIELKPYAGDPGPGGELHFKFYRQATNKIIGLTAEASDYLDGFFETQPQGRP